jgi:hypothetical protein
VTEEKGYPHFFYMKAQRLNGAPTAPRRIPCTCVLGKNHYIDNPLTKKEKSDV